MKRLFCWCIVALPLLGCGDWKPKNLTGPSDGTNLSAWSPAVGMHTPGGQAFSIQMAAAERLHRAGRMNWIRFSVYPYGGNQQYFAAAASMGLRIFVIIQMHDLQQYGWKETFDSVYRLYGGYPIEVWEIAGEVTNPNPNVNPGGTMTPEEFMVKFKDLYAHVKKNYPDVVLASPPTLGAVGGPAELERFFQLGLLDMDVVVTLNVYTDNALVQYGALFSRYARKLAGKRVWVAETGSDNPAHQIDHVERFYPRIRNALHPELIFWYVMWGGDEPPDQGFSLVSNIVNGQPLQESLLFKALVGAGEGR